MRFGSLMALLLLAIAAGPRPSASQTAPQPEVAAKPALPPVVISPVVQPDRRVTLRLWAPKAAEVTVTGDFLVLANHVDQPEKMVKDAQGVWSYTTQPLSPDEYSYVFLVDGLRVLDPVNGSLRRGVRRQASAFSVPGPEADFLALKPVPHGEIRTVLIDSPIEGKPRRMQIYLPPGYEQSQEKFPLLILIHGGGEDEWGWTDTGRANLILDNLIAAGKAKPMILAMPSLGAVNPQVAAVTTDVNKTNNEPQQRALVNEILPYLEQHYRLAPGSANRALGGLGVGRNMLPKLFWPSLTLFDWIGFAAGGTDPDVFAELDQKYPGVIDAPANTHRVKFFLANGANDSSVTASKFLAAELEKRGYATTLILDGGIHEWTAFRRHFAEFAQRVFR